MIDALVSGKLHAKPEQRIGASGKPFVTARVLASTSSDDRVLVSVIAFDAEAGRMLVALDSGDSVALSGSLSVKTFEARDGTTKVGIDMVAHAVQTAYHVRRKRKAVAGGDSTETAPADGDFNDDLPF